MRLENVTFCKGVLHTGVEWYFGIVVTRRAELVGINMLLNLVVHRQRRRIKLRNDTHLCDFEDSSWVDRVRYFFLDLFEILFAIPFDDFWNDLAFDAFFLKLVEVVSLDAQNVSVVLELICHRLRILLPLLI